MQRILIIDDEQPARQAVKQALEAAGYEVGRAGNDPEALGLLANRPWDLVLLGHSADANTGLGLLRSIHAEHLHLPVLLMRDDATITTVREALNAGAWGFVERRGAATEIGAIVAQILAGAAS